VIVDYHMHLRAPDESIEHTVEAVERYVEAAADHGIDEIGFTEHGYYFEQTRSLWSVPYQLERCKYDLDQYVDSVVEAKRRGYPVKLGLEVDFDWDLIPETKEALDPYPWDYLIGSVHFIDGLSVDGQPRLVDDVGWERAWGQYFQRLWRAAETGGWLIDVLAHPDLIRIFGDNDPPADSRATYLGLAEACAACGVCLEVSSAGLRKPLGQVYPHPELLQVAQLAGADITVASDAHVPQDVGRDLDRAIDHARAAGYETVTIFDQRQARQEPLG
jgi:histidinol-phosphatase (PHP family)